MNNEQPAAKLIEMEQSELFELAPTGTDGPAPQRAPRPVLVAKGARRPPAPVSYRVALRQITDTVLDELKHRGEQWDAGPRQDLISTLFIAATKDKKIIFDFEPDGER